MGGRMRVLRHLCISWLILWLVFSPLFSWSAAAPAYSGAVNNSVGSIVQFKAGRWGFAANDPKIKATTSAIGAGITTAATGLAIGAIAGISWPVLLASVGIAAVVSGSVSLGMDAALNWWWGTGAQSGQVQLSGTALPTGSASDFATMPADFATLVSTYGVAQDIWVRTSPTSTVPRHFRTAYTICPAANVPFCNGTSFGSSALTYDSTVYDSSGTAYGGPYPGVNGYWSRSATTASTVLERDPVTNAITKMGYTTVWEFQYPTSATKAFPGYVPAWVAPQQAVQDVPQAYSTQKLSDAQLAALVNALWKAMPASPDTIPWSSSDPVLPGDVATWRAANPQLAPTVGNFLEPIAAPGSSGVVIPGPGETQATTPSTGTTVDLGANPNIGSPTLESTPTAHNILDPILNLMPDLKSFSLPSHSGTCPTPVFDASAFRSGWVWTVSGHCSLIEDHRALISVLSVLCWTMGAAFIVLRA